MTIAVSLLCSSAINRVGSVEEVMNGEDGNRLRCSYASNHSCTFLFRVVSSAGPVLLSALASTATAFSLSSYKENASSSTSSSDTL